MKLNLKRQKKKIPKEKFFNIIIIASLAIAILVVFTINLNNQLSSFFGLNNSIHEYMNIQYDKESFTTNPPTNEDCTNALNKLVEGGLDIVTDNALDKNKIPNEFALNSNIELTANELHSLYNEFYRSVRFSSFLGLETRNSTVEYLQVTINDNHLFLTANIPTVLGENDITCMPEEFVCSCDCYLDTNEVELDCDIFSINALTDEQNEVVKEHIGELNCFLCKAFTVYYMQEFITDFCNTFHATYSFSTTTKIFAPIA